MSAETKDKPSNVGKKFLANLLGRDKKGTRKSEASSSRDTNRTKSSRTTVSAVSLNSRLTDSKEALVRFITENIEADKKRIELLHVCKQRDPRDFSVEFPESRYKKVERFDTGTYAEVFRATDAKDDKLVVFKVIRAVPKSLHRRIPKVSFSGSTTFEDILCEAIITLELSKLHSAKNFGGQYMTHGFPKVRHIKVVKGKIPDHFLRNQSVSQSGSTLTPLRKEPLRKFPGAPLEHVVMVMKHNGDPMWRVIKEKRVGPYELLSIAKQVTFGLAVAEKKFEFEHRDLHISNILIQTTSKLHVTFVLDGQEYRIETCGVKACIIDTTFSRFTIGREVYFKDMADILRPSANPPEKVTLQDHIYQRMVEETGNHWKPFKPKTNIFWLYYLYKTLLKSRIIRNSENDHVRESIEKILKLIHRETSVADIIPFLVEN
ncbi:Serine/threonine-protein kinase haspin -like protein [Halotydeus destructor]|nr:Serine/threonine-protein kinase haspin -like protein [Halotydeus destructor]